MTSPVVTYPESDKMGRVVSDSQSIGFFLDWLQGKKNVVLAIGHKHTRECFEEIDHKWHVCWIVRVHGIKRCKYRTEKVCGLGKGELIYWHHGGFERLFAEYFDIDLDIVEEERNRILELQRQLNKRKTHQLA